MIILTSIYCRKKLLTKSKTSLLLIFFSAEIDYNFLLKKPGSMSAWVTERLGICLISDTQQWKIVTKMYLFIGVIENIVAQLIII